MVNYTLFEQFHAALQKIKASSTNEEGEHILQVPCRALSASSERCRARGGSIYEWSATSQRDKLLRQQWQKICSIFAQTLKRHASSRHFEIQRKKKGCKDSQLRIQKEHSASVLHNMVAPTPYPSFNIHMYTACSLTFIGAAPFLNQNYCMFPVLQLHCSKHARHRLICSFRI